MNKTGTIEAWYFAVVDGQESPEPVGGVLRGSLRAIDALAYAAGELACRVEIGGELVIVQDNIAGQSRTVLASADATALLHEFACWCAWGALQRKRLAGKEPDRASWAAVRAKREWLAGRIGDQEMAKAKRAAERVLERVLGRPGAWQDPEWAAAEQAYQRAVKMAAEQAAAWAASAEGGAAQAAKRAAKSAQLAAVAWSEEERNIQNAELEGRLRALFAAAARAR